MRRPLIEQGCPSANTRGARAARAQRLEGDWSAMEAVARRAHPLGMHSQHAAGSPTNKGAALDLREMPLR
jgi:hypothetical protein